MRHQCVNILQKNPAKMFSMFIVLFAMAISDKALAEEFTFTVQPILSPEKTRQLYKPLTDYLSQHTGHTFKVVAERNFLSYWYKMKKGKYDLVLDAAHFIDFRVNHLDYNVLAKIPDTVSFSLVTSSSNLIPDHTDLIGKTLVMLPPPGIGAANLQKLYPSVTRQPVIITMKSANDAIKAVQSGKYFAALVPTPLLKDIAGLHVVTTTEPIPHMAVSASDKIDKELQVKITNALINAKNIPTGKTLLRKPGITAFDTTTAQTCKGYEKYLAGMIRPSRPGTTR